MAKSVPSRAGLGDRVGRFKGVCMANCVGNVPRGPNTGAYFPCAYTLGTSYNSKVHAGTITSGGRFVMTRLEDVL